MFAYEINVCAERDRLQAYIEGGVLRRSLSRFGGARSCFNPNCVRA